MTRIVYVNGRYLPYAKATVHAEDRGFQFADAVYEVCEVRGGRLVDEARHLARLERSLGELRMPPPMTPAALVRVMRETMRRNRVERRARLSAGDPRARPRANSCSPRRTWRRPSSVSRAPSPQSAGERRAAEGIAVKTVPDTRWGRCDIKTVMLLPACLAKEDAAAEGAREAWFVDAAGFVTEGASSNAWIVDGGGPARHPARRSRDPARRHAHHA